MATYNHSPAKSSASSPAERGILGTISRLREIEAHLRASCADERIAVKVGNIALQFRRLLEGKSADVAYLLGSRLSELPRHGDALRSDRKREDNETKAEPAEVRA